jgi:hypothetical protein
MDLTITITIQQRGENTENTKKVKYNLPVPFDHADSILKKINKAISEAEDGISGQKKLIK